MVNLSVFRAQFDFTGISQIYGEMNFAQHYEVRSQRHSFTRCEPRFV